MKLLPSLEDLSFCSLIGEGINITHKRGIPEALLDNGRCTDLNLQDFREHRIALLITDLRSDLF
jgi:hypothetical protein